MGNWIKTQIACPCGKSSDAYSIDENGNGFCFSGQCGGKFFRDNKEEEVDKSKYTTDYFPHRGLYRRILEQYGTQTKFYDGTPVETAFFYPNGAIKIRNMTKKGFHSKGDMKNASLFGKNVFDKGSKKFITITEGEYDAMSVHQMVPESAAVSVRSSSSAKADCILEHDYINSFDRIIINFDNDEPGQEAAKKVASLFDFRKVYNLVLDLNKDANGYLENDLQKEYYDAWKGVKRYTPDNLLSTLSEFKKALTEHREEKLVNYPFEQLQSKLFGIHSCEVVVIKGQEGLGKQLPNTTKIPTPSGWTTMGDLSIGDKIFGANGEETTVTFVTETQLNVPCFEVKFSDGTSQVCGGPHRWGVYNSSNGKYEVLSTDDILKRGVLRGEVSNFSVEINQPLNLPEVHLPIDPYLLGLWLGDGHSYSANISVGSSDLQEFTDQIKSRGFNFTHCKKEKTAYSVRVDGLTHDSLNKLEMLKNKHIPQIYLRSSINQRQELLRGLMDSDGSPTNIGCEFYSSNERLVNDFLDLSRGLGYKSRVRSKISKIYGVEKGIAWTVWFLAHGDRTIFSYKRKQQKVVYCKTNRATHKTIRSITPVESVPSKCITVDNVRNLYLCGDHYTVTHNTELLRAIENQVFKTTNHNIGIIHLEESNSTTLRAMVGYFTETAAMSPDMPMEDEEVLKVLSQIVGENEDRFVLHSSFDVEDEDSFIDNIRFMVSAHNCRLVFFDHISWLATGSEDKGDDERKKLDRISQRLKLLAKELKFALVMISHVNDDGKTRGSRNITKVANTVIHLERNKTTEDESERNKLHMMIEKARLPGAKEGPAGYAIYDTDTLMLIDPMKKGLEL